MHTKLYGSGGEHGLISSSEYAQSTLRLEGSCCFEHMGGEPWNRAEYNPTCSFYGVINIICSAG